MDHSSQHSMDQPSQQAIDGFPRGFPPTREHRHGADYPMAGDLQRRLAEIAKQNLAECPEGSKAGTYLSDE